MNIHLGERHSKPVMNPVGELHYTQIESEPWKLDAWAAQLNIPKQQVRQLAAEVGPVFEDIQRRWEERLSLRMAADAEMKAQKGPTDLTVNVARQEVLEWLRGVAGRPQSLKDEETAMNRSGELSARFLSHAKAAGFELQLFASGTPAEPGFRGEWRCHGAVVHLHDVPSGANQDQARLLACAALLRDELSRRYLDRQDRENQAA